MKIYQKNNKSIKHIIILYAFIILHTLASSYVYADTSNLPWETPLQKILASLTGPVTRILGVIAIVVAGLGIAFGEASSGMRRLFQIVFGLSIAFTASTLVVSLFGLPAGTTL